MTSFNNVVETPYLSCDGCNSKNIQETIQGYVCTDCGLVLEIHRLQYHRPYNEDIIQYAQLGSTQIGTRRERMCSKYSAKLESLNKLHSFRDNEKKVMDDAKVEILRILSFLKLPKEFLDFILPRVKKIRAKFKPSTKYRSIEKLVPVILYYSLRDQNISVNIDKLLEASKVEKAEFKHFRIQVRHYYKHRNSIERQIFISQKFLQIKEYFNLGMEFVFYAKKTMNRLWELIKNTTDNVVAGVSASITVLCYFNEHVSINAICKLLGIQMSTIQFQVKHRIFERLEVNGFTTLIKSSGLIQTIMDKLGISAPENKKLDPCNTMIKVEFGKAIRVFNHQRKEFDHYLFGLLTPEHNCIIIGLKLFNLMLEDDVSTVEHYPLELFELELCKYSHGKGPPLFKI